MRILHLTKPTRDLKLRLSSAGGTAGDESEAAELNQFIDLLDRCLALNPDKRCTPAEALRHPFLNRASKPEKDKV